MENNEASKKFNFKNYLLGTAAGIMATIGSLVPNAQAQSPQSMIQNNQPSQELVEKSPSEKLDSLLRINTYLNNKDTTKIKDILKKTLYPNSGHNYVLDESKGIKQFDGEFYYPLLMVGENIHTDGKITGLYVDEAQRNWSTTYGSMANQGGATPRQLKNSIHLSNGIALDEIKLLYEEIDGNKFFEGAQYTGSRPRSDTRTRVKNNGSVIEDWVNWQRGKTIFTPENVALKHAGYDANLLEEVIKDYNTFRGREEDIISDYEEKLGELNQEKDSILDEKKDIIAKKDSIYQDKTALQEFLKKAEAGAGLFMTQNQDLGYALEIGRGVGKNNATLSLLGIYQPGRTTTETSAPLVETTKEFIPTFNWYGVSTDSIIDSATKSWQGATGMIFYELFPNAAPGLSFGAGAKYVRENVTNNSTHRNDTWFESDDGVPFGHDSWTSNDVQHKTNNEFSPVVGAKYKLGPVNLFGTYNPSRKEANFGVVLNILQNKYVNDRRDNNSNNNNSTNNSNNVVND
jgi:hypothetical protein